MIIITIEFDYHYDDYDYHYDTRSW